MKKLILCLGMVSVSGAAFAVAEVEEQASGHTAAREEDDGAIDETLAQSIAVARSQTPEAFCTTRMTSFLKDVCKVSATLVYSAQPAELSAFKQLHDGQSPANAWRAVKGALATAATGGKESHDYARCEPDAAAKLCGLNNQKIMSFTLASELKDIKAGLAKANATPSAALPVVQTHLNRLAGNLAEIEKDEVMKKVIKTQNCRQKTNSGFGKVNRFMDSDYVADECK